MSASPVIRPKASLLYLCVAALIAAPIALLFVPNPFEGLALAERPVRFYVFLWVALPIMMLAALWRLATWTTYEATPEALVARSPFGAKSWPWSTLTSAALQIPTGMPPAYELRFGKKKVRLIARHFNHADVQRLRAFVQR
jgi:hypothetical protein